MEKLSKEEVLLKRLIKDAGNEKPSANFSANVLRSLPVKDVKRVYKPLISKNVWVALGAVYGLGVIVFFVFNSNLSMDLKWNLPFEDWGNLQLNIPKIELSRTMSYSIALISLFFLQIPFLKQYLEKDTESKF